MSPRASVAGKTLNDFPHVLTQLDRAAHPTVDGQYRAGERNEKLWWICVAGPDHRWQASAKSRCGGGTGCPSCAGRQISITNSLAGLFPEVSSELRPDLEPYLSADEIAAQANFKVFWQCPKGHVYPMRVANRTTLEQNCSVCAGKRVAPQTSLAALHPEIAEDWHPFNAKSASQVRPGDNRKYGWLCPSGHTYSAKPLHRVFSQSGCPYCSGRSACWDNCLANHEPEISSELNVEASGFTAFEVTAGSNQPASWTCRTDSRHHWEATVIERTGPNTRYGCPYCSGRRAWEENNLLVHFPKIAAELDPSLNNGLAAVDVLPFSAETVNWRCSRDPSHTWSNTVVTRTQQGTGCRHCGLGRRFSIVEIRLAHLLAQAIPVDLTSRYVTTPEGRVEVDIPVPEWKILIEYDGAYWHQSAECAARDHRKNAKLSGIGWRTIRLRQGPLPLIESWDIALPEREPRPEDLAHLVLATLSSKFGFDVPTTLDRCQQSRAIELANARVEELIEARLERRREQEGRAASKQTHPVRRLQAAAR